VVVVVVVMVVVVVVLVVAAVLDSLAKKTKFRGSAENFDASENCDALVLNGVVVVVVDRVQGATYVLTAEPSVVSIPHAPALLTHSTVPAVTASPVMDSTA